MPSAPSPSRFRLVALPIDFEVTTSAFAFNPEELVRLYQKGYEMAGAGEAMWRTTPPDTLPGEITPPRTGLQFIVP